MGQSKIKFILKTWVVLDFQESWRSPRHVARIQDKQNDFRKLLRSRRLKDLEKLYYEHEQNSPKRQMGSLLLQILQMQDVESVKEYTINGNRFKVYVLEDMDL